MMQMGLFGICRGELVTRRREQEEDLDTSYGKRAELGTECGGHSK